MPCRTCDDRLDDRRCDTYGYEGSVRWSDAGRVVCHAGDCRFPDPASGPEVPSGAGLGALVMGGGGVSAAVCRLRGGIGTVPLSSSAHCREVGVCPEVLLTNGEQVRTTGSAPPVMPNGHAGYVAAWARPKATHRR